MANADKTLLDKDEKEIYPITRERNVYDENNVNLKEKFKTVVFKDNEIHKLAQELYEESKNELDIDNVETLNGTSLNDNGTTSTNENYNVVDYLKVEPNTDYTYYIYSNYDGGETTNRVCSFDTNKAFLKVNIKKATGIGVRYIHFTTPSNAKYIRLQYRKTDTDIMLAKGHITVFYPFNPNRHITNSEAEFLKEEHRKSINLAPLENKVYSGSFSGTWGSFHIKLLQNFTLKEGKKYSWSAKIKSSDGCRMNKLGLTTNSETLINLYDYGNLTNNYITVSKTFTPTTDIVVDNIYVHNATVGSVDIKEIVVVEGDLEEYQPYNSASHITNPQADLLKSEYAKTYDIFNNGAMQMGAWVFGGGDYFESSKYISSKDFIPVQPNSTIYVNINDPLMQDISSTNNGFVFYNQNKEYMGSSQTFNPTKVPNGVYYCHINIAHTANVTLSDLIDLRLSSNGRIIWKKDIEPVFLWENPNPNSIYEPDNGVGEIPNDIELIGIGIKRNNTSTDGEQMFYIKPEQGKIYYLNVSYVSSGVQYTYSRTCYVTSARKVLFYEGYQNETVNNGSIIPTRILAFRRV